jgi:hypothetical protein
VVFLDNVFNKLSLLILKVKENAPQLVGLNNLEDIGIGSMELFRRMVSVMIRI